MLLPKFNFSGAVLVFATAVMTVNAAFAETPVDKTAVDDERELDGHTLVVADRVDPSAAQLPGAEQEQVREEVLDALHTRLKSSQADS